MRTLRYAVLVAAACLAACTPRQAPTVSRPDELRVVDPTTPNNEPAAPVSLQEPPARNTEIIRGTGSFVGRQPNAARNDVVASDNGISLNFVNADVAEVAKAVLGDYLKLNYVIDASVQGAVTLETVHPLPHDAVLPALEAAFRLSGLALIHTGETWRIVPLAEAPRQSEVNVRPGQPGFGVEIVPLHYVSATEMQRMLEPLSPSGSVLRADTERNFLVIAGTGEERQALLENIRLFDVDWMKGMSFAVFPLHSADASTVATELSQIIGIKDGPLAGVVRLTAIERMNSILAISSQPSYLDALQGWIDRLDHAQESSDRHLYVYRVQNGRAKDLADVLSKVMDSGGQTNTATTAPTVGPQLPAVPEQVLSQLSQSPSRNTIGQQQESGNPSSSAGNPQDSDQKIRITADETNNAILVLAKPNDYEIVRSALVKLDTVPLQVLLEASVAEVTLTDQLSYGLQFFLESGPRNQIYRTNNSSSVPLPVSPGFNYVLNAGNDIQATLSALDSITHVNVLSAPNIMVLNNQTASLQVGDSVPISTQSSVSVATSDAPVINSIEYRDTGVILKVTPRVNQGGMVTMDVSQEVSDVSSTVSSGLNSPTFTERKISSTIAVPDGETVAIGGLIKDNRSTGRSGIPILQDIPYLGAAFGDNTESVNRTELLVLIKPHVVQGVQQLRSVTEELRLKMPATLQVMTPVHPSP